MSLRVCEHGLMLPLVVLMANLSVEPLETPGYALPVLLGGHHLDPSIPVLDRAVSYKVCPKQAKRSVLKSLSRKRGLRVPVLCRFV